MLSNLKGKLLIKDLNRSINRLVQDIRYLWILVNEFFLNYYAEDMEKAKYFSNFTLCLIYLYILLFND